MTTPSLFGQAGTRSRFSAALIIAISIAASSWLVVRADIPHVSSGTWVTAGDVGAIPAGAASLGLPDGRVLVAGGEVDGAPSARVAIYDPDAGLWSNGGDLMVARSGHAVTLLNDGRVLIAGGTTASGPTFDIEIYNPTAGFVRARRRYDAAAVRDMPRPPFATVVCSLSAASMASRD